MIELGLALLIGLALGAALVLYLTGRETGAGALGALAVVLGALATGRAWGRRGRDSSAQGTPLPAGLDEPTDPRTPPRRLPTDHTRPEDHHEPPPPAPADATLDERVERYKQRTDELAD